MTVLLSILAIVLSYILGSIPPSYVIGKVFFDVDIRTQGSGNVGGANAGRLFGKKVMAVVGLFDILKGTVAVLLTRWISENNLAETGFFAVQSNIIALAAFFAVIGHCYSIWLSFSGGKGGATTAGIMLALDPLSFLGLLIVWVLIVGTTRFTSLGNLVGVLVIPPLLAIRLDGESYLVLGIALVLLIYWTHRENVGRLIRGEERKFGNKEKIEKD